MAKYETRGVMAKHETSCANCRWWNPVSEDKELSCYMPEPECDTWGVCQFERAKRSKVKGASSALKHAWATDCPAFLYTAPEFGCVEYEAMPDEVKAWMRGYGYEPA